MCRQPLSHAKHDGDDGSCEAPVNAPIDHAPLTCSGCLPTPWGTVPDIAKLKHKLGSFNAKELAKTAHKSIKQAASKHLKKMKAGLKGALGGDQLKEVDRKVREGLKDAAEAAKMKEAR